ncbi:hypothetical protein JTB14_012912 [Gonioctena quinquepunctata]|nr:hypothetical protein JTB14_012912 [Gonioctena quinquepunctata]
MELGGFFNIASDVGYFHDNSKALKILKYPVDQWDFIIVQMILIRSDVSIATRSKLHYNSTAIPTYRSSTEFSHKRCIALENIHGSREMKPEKIEFTKTPSVSRPSTSLLVQENNVNCSFCNCEHFLCKCPEFLKKSANERY